MLSIVNDSSRIGWAQTIRDSQAWLPSLRAVRQSGPQPSMGDITKLYPEIVVASSDALGWQNIRAIQLGYNLSELLVPPVDSYCLLLNFGPVFHLSAEFNKRSFEGEVRAGEVAIIPAGSSWTSKSKNAHFSKVLLLYFRLLFIRSAVPEFSENAIGLTPQIGFRNNQIRHLAMSLMQELNEANIVSGLYADSLAIGLAMQLVRCYSSLQKVWVGHGGMAPHKLRKAIAMIDHHLAEEQEGRVALRAVAKHIGMSYFHFSRAFKQSMGMSPTNYIAERRILRAKELLNATQLPISEIALRSGFSSQSHFTNAFRRMAGSSPKDFRAAI